MAVKLGETYQYSFKSPVVGLHASGQNKLQDKSVTKLTFKAHPYQKDHVIHEDLCSVVKSMKFDCYSGPPTSATQDAFSGSRKESSTINYGLKEGVHKTPHELAQEYRYISNIHNEPDKNETTNLKISTNQLAYTPYSSSYFKDREVHHNDLNRSSKLGGYCIDPDVKSEYKKSFVRDVGAGDEMKGTSPGFISDNATHGRAKLNVTHNIITGDRFNKRERKLGTSAQSEEYPPWPVGKYAPSRNSAVETSVSSIPQGDREKLYDKVSTMKSEFQCPHESSPDKLTFQLSEKAADWFKSSVKFHSDQRAFNNFVPTMKGDYVSFENAEKATLAGSAYTRGASSFPEGDLDANRVMQRISGDTTKSLHVKHPRSAWAEQVDRGGVTQSSIQLGSFRNAPISSSTSHQETFAPYTNLSLEHIIPPPKDLLTIRPMPDCVPSTQVHDPKVRHPHHFGLSRKIKNTYDFKTRIVDSLGEPSFKTCHKDDFSADVLAKSTK